MNSTDPIFYKALSADIANQTRPLDYAQVDKIVQQVINRFQAFNDAIPSLCDHCQSIVRENVLRSLSKGN